MTRGRFLEAALAGAAAVTLVFVVAVAHRNVAEMRTLRDQGTLVTHTLEVQRTLDAILLAESQADSAVRGYLLTRDEAARRQFLAARTQTAAHIDRLAVLTADNRSQQARIPRLRATDAQLAERLHAVLLARATGTAEQALAHARDADTIGARGEIRRVVAEMEEEEARLLEDRRRLAAAAYSRAVRGRVGSAVVSGTLLVVVAIVAVRYTRSNTKRQQVLVESERRAREAAAREQEARTEAERANLRKDEFLAVLSHELRTPLNAVLGWTQILQASAPPDPSVTKALASIRRSAEAQQRLVEDLLDVSRIVADKLPMERIPFDLRTTIAAAVESVRPAAAGKRLALDARLQHAGVVEGDPLRVQQVAVNLLANAVKFTPEGGRIEVSLTGQDHAAVLDVRDTGVGFDPALAPHVFERFRQADGSSTRAHGGLGLGLAIAKHIVDAHRGTIEAASEGPNRGAAFRVRLQTV